MRGWKWQISKNLTICGLIFLLFDKLINLIVAAVIRTTVTPNRSHICNHSSMNSETPECKTWISNVVDFCFYVLIRAQLILTGCLRPLLLVNSLKHLIKIFWLFFTWKLKHFFYVSHTSRWGRSLDVQINAVLTSVIVWMLIFLHKQTFRRIMFAVSVGSFIGNVLNYRDVCINDYIRVTENIR